MTTDTSERSLERLICTALTGSACDPGESITECRAFAPAEFRAMIARGEIRDANTLCAFARLAALGLA